MKLITRLTGCNASYETSTRIINLDYTGGIKFMETYYDYSNNLTGVTSITNNGLKDDKIE